MVRQQTGSRPARAEKNDERIRDMATGILAGEGVAGLTLGRVARSLGVSHNVLSSRYGELDDLLCDVWASVAVPQISLTLVWIFGLVARLGDRFTASDAVIDQGVFRKTREKLVMLELLALAPTRPKLRKAVQETFEEQLGDRARNDPHAATQAVFLFALVIGVQAELRTTSANQSQLAAVMSEVVTGMAQPGEAVALPEVDASHMRRYKFQTGDERRDRILTSCLELVSERGLVGATTKAIAEHSGVSEGVIFSLFESKIDIFLEATVIQSEMGYQANLDFVMSLNERFGTGIGNAILIREWLSPDLSRFRASLLEETRIMWHDVDLWRRLYKVKQDLVGDDRLAGKTRSLSPSEQAVQMVTLAMPIGIYMVGEAFPAAFELPFSIVTLPVFS